MPIRALGSAAWRWSTSDQNLLGVMPVKGKGGGSILACATCESRGGGLRIGQGKPRLWCRFYIVLAKPKGKYRAKFASWSRNAQSLVLLLCSWTRASQKVWSQLGTLGDPECPVACPVTWLYSSQLTVHCLWKEDPHSVFPLSWTS